MYIFQTGKQKMTVKKTQSLQERVKKLISIKIENQTALSELDQMFPFS